jgi:hypothetical protein
MSALELLAQFQSKSGICNNTIINYIENNQPQTGRTLGLDASGALLCSTANGPKALMVSEVSRVRKS